MCNDVGDVCGGGGGVGGTEEGEEVEGRDYIKLVEPASLSLVLDRRVSTTNYRVSRTWLLSSFDPDGLTPAARAGCEL